MIFFNSILALIFHIFLQYVLSSRNEPIPWIGVITGEEGIIFPRSAVDGGFSCWSDELLWVSFTVSPRDGYSFLCLRWNYWNGNIPGDNVYPLFLVTASNSVSNNFIPNVLLCWIILCTGIITCSNSDILFPSSGHEGLRICTSTNEVLPPSPGYRIIWNITSWISSTCRIRHSSKRRYSERNQWFSLSVHFHFSS